MKYFERKNYVSIVIAVLTVEILYDWYVGGTFCGNIGSGGM